jgi:hypothetical protein
VRVEAFQTAEGDAIAAALAVGLEVEQQDREARRREQAGARHHVEPIALHAVHQHDRAAARPSRDEPAAQRGAGGRGDRDLFGMKVRRPRSDLRSSRSREKETDGNDGDCECDGSDGQPDGCNAKDHPPGATAPLTPAFSIARVTKLEVIAAAVNSFTTAAVRGRSLA